MSDTSDIRRYIIQSSTHQTPVDTSDNLRHIRPPHARQAISDSSETFRHSQIQQTLPDSQISAKSHTVKHIGQYQTHQTLRHWFVETEGEYTYQRSSYCRQRLSRDNVGENGSPTSIVASGVPKSAWERIVTRNSIARVACMACLLTPWCRVPLEKLTVLQLVNSPHFTEPEGSLPHSQASATCLYPRPAQSSPYTHIPTPGDPS